MEDTTPLRRAVLTWLQEARDLPSVPQAITDVALASKPGFSALGNAIVDAAPRSEHRDLYGKTDGDWLPRWSTLLGESGLGDATRLVAQGVTVPVESVANSFVAFCTAPAPVVEEWLLLNGELPVGTRIPLGLYTLQSFTAEELEHMGPMPALCGLQPGGFEFRLLEGAPFLHAPNPERAPDRRGPSWFAFPGPRPEARHWRALLPLILWSADLLHVDAVFDVERGRRFDLDPNHVPTTIRTYDRGDGVPDEVDARDIGPFDIALADLPRLQAFCAAVTARIDAVMDGTTSDRRLPKRRARRLERAARHLVGAYQRTYTDDGVWPQEADELHLDYVIALEALMTSPLDNHEGITKRFQTRMATLFADPSMRERVREEARKAYGKRSDYVHGDVLGDLTETQQLAELRALRLLTREVILRWLVLTPSDTQDLAPRLDAAADCISCAHLIEEPLHAFFQQSPPQDNIRV
ncbi:hypothetical protein ACFWD7_23720 [Streptomyces mirabilis]|uniref:hypothetical protein n=1 Tax=Streptomyces mirabilis TaxID=68239 RepID=UPI0036972031